MNRLASSVLLALCGVLPTSFTGCGSAPAKLRAERMGDLSYTLGDRRSPDSELVAACGNGATTPAGVQELRRTPYLQQVTPSSALLVFTGKGQGANLVVSKPDGTPVASAPSETDPTVAAGSAQQQFARIEGLEPDTLYCYELAGLTGRAGFRTAPAPESADPVRFIAFGDSGDGGPDQFAVMEQMRTVPFDLIVHTGDVAYNSGTLGQLETGYFGVYAGLIRSFPSYPASGNHDYATDGARPFRDVFMLPENAGPEQAERWYSFDRGIVHFAALDTELTGPEQARWLDLDLAASDKPWKIVYAHRPPFSSGKHGSNMAFRQHFLPVLEKHGVRLVLTGHDHHYERTRPISGVTYIVTGGGGHGTRPVGASEFTAFAEDVLHFVQIEVHGDELTLHAIDGTGVEFDSARITRRD
jgi:acid phosphatase type 7